MVQSRIHALAIQGMTTGVTMFSPFRSLRKPATTRTTRRSGAKSPLQLLADIPGMALGAAGARRYRVFRPTDVKFNERLPLLVMLHGCGQDAKAFAENTRMNRIAQRERFVVLYPEQSRFANANGCWNWFDTKSGRAYGEASIIMNAIDQVCLLHPVDRSRVAVAGLSAGASMAMLLATLHPDRFQAVSMHSGIPPGTADSSLSAIGAMLGRRDTLPMDDTQGPSLLGLPALLVIHGDSDLIVSQQNGLAAVETWGEAMGAKEGPPRNVQSGRRYPARVMDFKRRGRIVARFVGVSRLTHKWSGGGSGNKPCRDKREQDASRMVWSFAAKQFRR